MMRWPWSREPEPERRESQPFTDAIVEAILAGAEGANATAAATAALEACAALYAGAGARARVEGAGPWAAVLTAPVLALMMRRAIRAGEDIHAIDVDRGMMSLRPAGTWDVRGGPDPAGWWYRVDIFGPSGNVTRFLPAPAVVHVRYAVDPARPWLGLGPMQWASSTAAMAGRIEAGIAAEAGAPSAQLVPIPTEGGHGGDDDPLANLKTDIAKAKGKPMLVETTAAGWGTGAAGAPRRDWAQSRVGPEWPAVLAETRRHVSEDVARACGVPFALLDGRAEGTSQREALRRFLHLGLEPLGELVAAELAEKLDRPGLRIDFSPLMASDLAGKARAIKGMVDAGIALTEAVMVAGLGD